MPNPNSACSPGYYSAAPSTPALLLLPPCGQSDRLLGRRRLRQLNGKRATSEGTTGGNDPATSTGFAGCRWPGAGARPSPADTRPAPGARRRHAPDPPLMPRRRVRSRPCGPLGTARRLSGCPSPAQSRSGQPSIGLHHGLITTPRRHVSPRPRPMTPAIGSFTPGPATGGPLVVHPQPTQRPNRQGPPTPRPTPLRARARGERASPINTQVGENRGSGCWFQPAESIFPWRGTPGVADFWWKRIRS